MWRIMTGCIILVSLSLHSQEFGETVVVTASMAPTEKQLESATATVLTEEDLRNQKVFTLGELLRLEPGLTLLQSGSPGKAMSLFSRGTESDHTLVLFNGIPLNSPYFAGYDLSLVPVEALSRVEIIRGPFSALYGPDAVGGVIQLFSSSENHWGGEIASGESGYRHTSMSVGRGGLFAGISYHEEDGSLDNDGFRQSQALFQWNGSHTGFVYRYGGQSVEVPYSESGPTPNRKMDSSNHTLVAPLRLSLGASIKWETRLGYSMTDFEFRDPDDPWGYTEGNTDTSRLFMKSHVEADLNGWMLLSGVEWRRDTVDDRSNFGTNLESESITNGAVFFLIRRSFRSLHIRAGCRYDDHETFGNSLNPRIGLTWSTGDHALTGEFGTSFRPPSIGELYFPGSGNLTLQPEKGRSWNIGYRFSHEGTELSMNFFRNDLKELIDFDYATFTFMNVGKSRILGTEIALRQELDQAGALKLSVTLMDHENVVTEESLLRRPEIQISGIYNVKFGTVMDFTFSGFYMGERMDIDPITYETVQNGSFTRMDATLRKTIKNIAPYLRIENIFDSEYEEILGYPSPGRRWIVGLSVRGVFPGVQETTSR